MSDAWHRLSDGTRTGAVIAVALVIGFLVWLLLIRDGGDDDAATTGGATTGPVRVSRAELASFSNEIGQPIYWIGRQQGTKFELTHLADGRVYVRYLPNDVQIGDPEPDFLTVGTYPVADARAALTNISQQEGAISDTEDGGDTLIVTNESVPESVYLAHRNQDENFQVEVYDPDPDRAFEIATSGAVEPIG